MAELRARIEVGGTNGDIEKVSIQTAESTKNIGFTNNIPNMSYGKGYAYNPFILGTAKLQTTVPSDYQNTFRLVEESYLGGTLYPFIVSSADYGIKFNIVTLSSDIVNDIKFTFGNDLAYPKDISVLLTNNKPASTSEIIRPTDFTGGYDLSYEIKLSLDNIQAGVGIKEIYFKNWYVLSNKSRTKVETKLSNFTTSNKYSFHLLYINLITNKIDVPETKIYEADSLIEYTTDAGEIVYNTLTSSGSITLSDFTVGGSKYLILKTYAQENYFEENNATLYLYLKDGESEKIIAKHNIRSATYNEDDITISFSLADDIVSWEEYKHEDIYIQAETSLYDIALSLVNSCFDNQYGNLGTFFANLDTNYVENGITVEGYLRQIKVEREFVLKSSTFTNSLNKILTVAQLCCFINSEGNVELVNARPTATIDELSTDKIIQILPHKQYKTLSYDLIVRNKYNTVSFQGTGLSFEENEE